MVLAKPCIVTYDAGYKRVSVDCMSAKVARVATVARDNQLSARLSPQEPYRR
ncbi:hypothetical protein EV129_11258 [Rhizobium azibense]|uniref:Uncharacterized protein n=1 Tax=Rhizobium azibense TaxID=1136135 RepID=A0A4R3RL91_9HYPH|nr:hypothetical protein EV129_11258 [Rhizobium azibense]